MHHFIKRIKSYIISLWHNVPSVLVPLATQYKSSKIITKFVTEPVVDVIHIIPSLLHDLLDYLHVMAFPNVHIQQTWVSMYFPKIRRGCCLAGRSYLIQAVSLPDSSLSIPSTYKLSPSSSIMSRATTIQDNCIAYRHTEN